MSGILAFIGFGFWMWMLYDCVRNEPDRTVWLWLLIFLNVPGAGIYCLSQVIPRLNLPMFKVFRKWTWRTKLQNAEAAVNNIGKAHQHTQYGTLLLEVGDFEQAQQHFQRALDKEPLNTDALWGLASIAARQKNYEEAKQLLDLLLKKDPRYKYGDASLLRCKVLVAQESWEIAEPALKQDVQDWSHPEAVLLLAQRQVALHDTQTAKTNLETMLFKVKASPAFHYKRNRPILRKAEKLLKTLR
jgi:hypothetical protein